MSKNFSILIVDDEEAVRDAISSMIESVSNETVEFSLLEATDGADALRKISVQKFDLLITDIHMPKMDGHKLMLQIKETIDKQFQPSHYLIVSGHADPEDFDEDVSVLLKPFKLDDLIGKIRGLLGGKKKSAPSKKKPAKVANRINVEFINPFIDATLEVLDVMCSTKAEKDFVFVKEPSDSFGDISGLIPIQSEQYIGSMAITFPEPVYLDIMSKMMGEEYSEINEENRDGVAELCNQIFGNAKAVLATQGFKLDMTLPSIITGNNHVVSHAVQVSQVLAVYFKTDVGSFVIECVLTSR